MVASIMTLPHYCLGEVVPVKCFRPVSSADENGFVAGSLQQSAAGSNSRGARIARHRYCDADLKATPPGPKW
ncbi:hypothetical protein, partial [Bradyrhizobium brasilense]|uniref:hypothetical protein n=1 Tax=Bradyrhizobium brasilense TaxID=1419277 RepID=UPI001E631AA0